MTNANPLPIVADATALLAAIRASWPRRILLFGAPGAGKSTLATRLARALGAAGHRIGGIGADPGSPPFGPPGAVSCGEWQGNDWMLAALEPLCTLDAGRYRLPLAAAVRRLAQGRAGWLLVDAPGVARGMAGAELVEGLVEAAEIDLILALTKEGALPPLAAELQATGREVIVVRAAAAARSPSPEERARVRTGRWDAYLAAATEHRLCWAETPLIGAPPPPLTASAWIGRQVAWRSPGRPAVLGEVLASDGVALRVRLAGDPQRPGALLVRDARRDARGLLRTAPPLAAERQSMPTASTGNRPAAGGHSTGPRPRVEISLGTATLVNGVFGDPLLHLRLRQQPRGLLFDLGESGHLPARLIHQVTDIFISHAHADHIAGFLGLLRARVGVAATCRIFGPPGLADHIAALVRGIHWDRVGATGPRFAVAEYDGERLTWRTLQAGRFNLEPARNQPAPEGVIWEEPLLRVRAQVLDHGIPVLAFALEQPRQFHVRPERLRARGLAPGPWLGDLKRRLAADDSAALIRLPDGRCEPAGALAADLVLITPGQKLIYATDLADSAANRARLIALAQGASVLFCEAAFLAADAEQAARTSHLTARACGEIAVAANVAALIPFHFSRRYQAESERAYAEIRAVCPRVVEPREASARTHLPAR